jgi:hypothetical protein
MRPSRLMKNTLGVLRRAQDERRVAEMIEYFPFMQLVEAFLNFFSNLLGHSNYQRTKAPGLHDSGIVPGVVRPATVNL